MALHHRREVADMRAAYGYDQANAQVHSSPESGSEQSYRESHRDGSSYTRTPPTSYSSSPTKRSPVVHNNTSRARHNDIEQFFDDRQPQESPRSSVETYASTVPSEEEFLEDLPEYQVPEFTATEYESQAIAATPSDFSELFPSCRRLTVRHDDSTEDGNMNLRLDTPVSIHGRNCDMTLFHLRMHDLKTRDFSLRRYCRDSGREVCHSTRKQQKPASEKRPGFQRSLSNALNSMRPKSEHRSSTGANVAALTRHDSGYGSMHSVEFDESNRPRSSGQGAQAQEQLSTDTIHLEFSNYAHLDIRRLGTNGKRYEFEYWGIRYSWKRVLLKDHSVKQTSFQLTKAGNDRILGHIVPDTLTPRQREEEQTKGGWIPPCSMWIADESIVRSQKDLSDVIVAAGLIALVDDSIRSRFSKNERPLLIPVPKLQVGIEYVGPKQLINEMFHRTEGSSTQRPPTSRGK